MKDAATKKVNAMVVLIVVAVAMAVAVVDAAEGEAAEVAEAPEQAAIPGRLSSRRARGTALAQYENCSSYLLFCPKSGHFAPGAKPCSRR